MAMIPDPAAGPDGDARRAFVLVGPTASGKTGVAHALAARMGARILSADSMLVYRGLNLGTAKPTAAELSAGRYAGVNLTDPDQSFSVADYLAHVGAVLRQDPAALWIVAGGTGLYVKCLLQGLDAGPGRDPVARAEAEAALEAAGVAGLAGMVRAAAPEARVRDDRNPRRLIRAFERARQGETRWKGGWSLPRTTVVGLLPDRALLLRRIEARARAMFEGGLLDEARSLRAAWPQLSATARQAIGYREAFAVLDGAMTAAAAVERTIVRTRQLAKRQMTWFRHQASVDWVPVGEGQSPGWIASEVLRRWENHGPSRLAV